MDTIFEGGGFLIFVEAKLGSDVSQRTTYDPLRNQIERNIDCAVEEAGDRDLYSGCSSRIGNRNSRIRRSSSAIDPMWRCSNRGCRTKMPRSWRELLSGWP